MIVTKHKNPHKYRRGDFVEVKRSKPSFIGKVESYTFDTVYGGAMTAKSFSGIAYWTDAADYFALISRKVKR